MAGFSGSGERRDLSGGGDIAGAVLTRGFDRIVMATSEHPARRADHADEQQQHDADQQPPSERTGLTYPVEIVLARHAVVSSVLFGSLSSANT